MICKSFSSYIQLNTLQRQDIFSKYSIAWNLFHATHSKKAGTGACLSLCYIVWEILSHSRLMYNFSAECGLWLDIVLLE